MSKRKREESELELKKTVAEILRNEEVKIQSCDIGIFHYKEQRLRYKNELIMLTTYLTKEIQMKLFVWNPYLRPEMNLSPVEAAEILKLDSLVSMYMDKVAPMFLNQNTIFFIPYVSSTVCGGNLMEKIEQKRRGRRPEYVEKKDEGVVSSLLLLRHFNHPEEVVTYSYFLLRANRHEIGVVLFLIYWTLELSLRKDLQFNFVDYRSIKILRIPSTVFLIRYSDQEVYCFSTKFIPLIDLYYCDLNNRFNDAFFSTYTDYIIGQTLNLSTQHSGSFNILQKLKSPTAHVIFDEEAIDHYKKSPLVKKKIEIFDTGVFFFRGKESLLRYYDGRISSNLMNNFGLDVINNYGQKYDGAVNILFIDKLEHDNFVSNEKSVKNSLDDFVIERFYLEHIPPEEKKKQLIQTFYRSGYGHYDVTESEAFEFQLSNNGKYRIDFKNRLNNGEMWNEWSAASYKAGGKKEHEYEYNAIIFELKESQPDKVKIFQDTYDLAIKADENGLGVKIIDKYFFYQITVEKLTPPAENLVQYGVIITEKKMTLYDYIHENFDDYLIYKYKIKEKLLELAYQISKELNYTYRYPAFNLKNIVIEKTEPEISLYISNFFDLIDKNSSKTIDTILNKEEFEAAKKVWNDSFNNPYLFKKLI